MCTDNLAPRLFEQNWAFPAQEMCCCSTRCWHNVAEFVTGVVGLFFDYNAGASFFLSLLRLTLCHFFSTSLAVSPRKDLCRRSVLKKKLTSEPFSYLSTRLLCPSLATAFCYIIVYRCAEGATAVAVARALAVARHRCSSRRAYRFCGDEKQF